MKIFVRAILLLAISIAASAASAASAQMDLPGGASLTPQQTGPTSFALTLDYPQCNTVSVWGEGDAIRIDCFDSNGQRVGTGGGISLQLELAGCPEVSAWGSGTATSGIATNVDCVLDVARQRVQEAYLAYYGRPADPAGLAYWTGQLKKAGGSLAPIIDAFGKSPEFDARYGGLSKTDLVTAVYRQTLDRDPDATGLAWYVGQLNSGASSLGTIALNVLDGAVTRPDATVVVNRTHVANYYTDWVEHGCALPTPGSDPLASITAESKSVNDALDAMDRACGG
jgi:hypothetical protein